MVNATTDEVYVALLSIDEGHTYDDLVAHVAKEQARSEAGKPALGPPAWVIAADDGDTAPGRKKRTLRGSHGRHLRHRLRDVEGQFRFHLGGRFVHRV